MRYLGRHDRLVCQAFCRPIACFSNFHMQTSAGQTLVDMDGDKDAASAQKGVKRNSEASTVLIVAESVASAVGQDSCQRTMRWTTTTPSFSKRDCER